MAYKTARCSRGGECVIPFSKRLSQLLRERGITVEQFEADGMSRQIIYDKRKRRRVTLMGLAYFFGMTVDELVKGTTA